MTEPQYPSVLTIRSKKIPPLNHRNYELWRSRLLEQLEKKHKGPLDILTGKIPMDSPAFSKRTDLELHDLIIYHTHEKRRGYITSTRHNGSGVLLYDELEREHAEDKLLEVRYDIVIRGRSDLEQREGEDIIPYLQRAASLFAEADLCGMFENDEKIDKLHVFNTKAERMAYFKKCMTQEYRDLADTLQSEAGGRLDQDWLKLAWAMKLWKAEKMKKKGDWDEYRAVFTDREY